MGSLMEAAFTLSWRIALFSIIIIFCLIKARAAYILEYYPLISFGKNKNKPFGVIFLAQMPQKALNYIHCDISTIIFFLQPKKSQICPCVTHISFVKVLFMIIIINLPTWTP